MFIFTSCGISDCPPIKKPADLKPIDMESFNDVHTVYWHGIHYCEDVDESASLGTIKIYGWINGIDFHSIVLFDLVGDPKDIQAPNIWTKVFVRARYSDELKIKLDTADLSKKCYIRGEMSLDCLYSDGCSTTVAEIWLSDINDIWFEE